MDARDVDEQLLNDTQVAELLGIMPGTLRAWRARRQGPPHVQLSSRTPRYRRREVLAWIESRAVGVAG